MLLKAACFYCTDVEQPLSNMSCMLPAGRKWRLWLRHRSVYEQRCGGSRPYWLLFHLPQPGMTA